MSVKIWPEPKVVVIGGGSGVSTILPGLKQFTTKLTAIITVADDGGSTGRLREDLGIIAPGDIRNCLVSLANTDRYMKDLFDYRFDRGELKGHSFGNLFIAALNDIYKDFGQAIYKAGEILSITGKVLPVTLENTSLVAKLENGDYVSGESNISKEVLEKNTRISKIHLEPKEVELFEDAKKDLLEADIIILGPGSLYTSIIPNLLTKDVTSLIKKSNAKVYYIVNAVTQKGETDNYSVKDHYDAIIKHSDNIIDSVVINNSIVSAEILKKYKKENQDIVLATDEELNFFKDSKIEILQDDLIEVINKKIRHNSDKVARLIFSNLK